MTSGPRKLVGVLSDTHGKLDERIPALFEGVYRIIHAGDIGDEDLIWRLESIAPVIAVRGNIDSPKMCFPTERMAVIEGRTFYIRHQFSTVEQMTPAQKHVIEERMPEIVVFGHSHKAYVDEWRGTLFFNPGGAGPKRFNLPRTVGLITLKEDCIEPRIINLENSSSCLALVFSCIF
ncbi:MAG TPA: metallophosphoesterase family protein [Pyrinomonadaceae bacterium]|nr:metallophosphoesterase family protein [Pyrinomonadaceae bacterium]